MFRQKAWGAITPLLLGYLDQRDAVPENRAERLRLVTRLFEDFGNRLTAPMERPAAEGFFEHAGKLLNESTKAGSTSQMTLAAFYARRGKLSAAIDLLERFGEKAAPPERAVAAVAVVTAEQVTPDQLRQVEKILTAAAAAHQQSNLLLTALGVLKIRQGQAAEAESYYRQIIKIDPNDFRAYNNLAVLLALSGKNTDEALELINRAIDLAGSQPSLLDSRAVVRIKREEYQQAQEDLDVILADRAGKIDPIWLFHKAFALWKAQNSDQARDVLRKARNDYNLERAKVDPLERSMYDDLEKGLQE